VNVQDSTLNNNYKLNIDKYMAEKYSAEKYNVEKYTERTTLMFNADRNTEAMTPIDDHASDMLKSEIMHLKNEVSALRNELSK
jgi:hypothetical protein